MGDTHAFVAHANPDRSPSCVRCGRGREHSVHEVYVCANGHPFRWPQAVRCDQCEAAVVMVPTAEVYRLREKLALYERVIEELNGQARGLEADLERERLARRAVDKALKTALSRNARRPPTR